MTSKSVENGDFVAFDPPFGAATPLPQVAWRNEDGLFAWRIGVLHTAVRIAQDKRLLVDRSIAALRILTDGSASLGTEASTYMSYAALQRENREITTTIKALLATVHLLTHPAYYATLDPKEAAHLLSESGIHTRALIMAHRGWTVWPDNGVPTAAFDDLQQANKP